MKYAVISVAGVQHKVSQNDIITINQTEGKEGDQLSSDQVLLVVDQDQVKLGQPFVAQAKVNYQIVKTYQGKKIKVFKYRSKSRYHKTQGFRPQLADIKILEINQTK